MAKIWRESLDEREYTEAEIVSEGWFDYALSFRSGEPAPRPFPDTTLEILSDHPPPDFFEPGTLFTVSDRLRSVLEEFKAPAEFFPLRVVYGGQDYTERAFSWCNILDIVDCFDLARGKYTFWKKPGFTDHVDEIQRLAIDEGKAAGHDFFRIAKGGEYIVCVSDRVASRIVQRQLTGVRLIEPRDWRFGCG